MVTSDHTTTSITNMLRHMREKYEHKYKEDLRFKTIVSDFSWATMHAILEVFNRETIEDYSKRIFDVSQLTDLVAVDRSLRKKTSITSCVSHTMARFARSVKKVANEDQRTLAMYGFSLLLNCLDLNSIGNVFRIISFVFLSKKQNLSFKKNFDDLNQLVETRPIYVRNCVKQVIIYNNQAKDDDGEEPTSDEDNCGDSQDKFG